ncbi:unnamed protein product [Cuscuta campestris]|uniref:Uncharacterized protein n=1 Tax=Cuscuta campestris TaxID=132261 RepID=A0A484MTS0_9ASTE|nr:unnamed protein product [Cuscuta campestris]
MLPEYPPSQVSTGTVVHEVEPTEEPDSEPPMLLQEQKEEEVLPMAINDHILNCVEDTPPEEPVLEKIEPTTYPQDSNIQESEEESKDEEIPSTEEPITSIDNHASSEDLDQIFFDSLLDGCDFVCPKDSWSQKSWDELLVSDTKDSSMGESMVVIIKPQMDSQPIEDKEGINFAIKANDVDQPRRLPPPPTYTKSPPFILLPPNSRDESRILDLDRATNQTRWHQKRVRRAKLYDSRIGKSRKKWRMGLFGRGSGFGHLKIKENEVLEFFMFVVFGLEYSGDEGWRVLLLVWAVGEEGWGAVLGGGGVGFGLDGVWGLEVWPWAVGNPYDDDYQVDNGSDYSPYHEEPPYDTPSRNFGYSPYQDSDGDNYYEPHGDQDDYDHNGPMYDNQPDPLVEEIIRLEQKIFYFDELLFAEGSWYEPPYSRYYTLFAEEQIEANKVAIRERAKLLESVRKEKEFERRLCEGSDMMQKMLNDLLRERLEAEAKADKLVNDLCKAVELKRSLQSQDQLREINVQKEALEPKTNPEPINQQVPVLEDSPSSIPSQKPESITSLAKAFMVILPESLPSQASIVVQKVEPTEGPDSEPTMLIQEKKEEEVLPLAINDHLLNCVQDTPPEEPVLEEVEPTTCPQDSIESEQESTDEEVRCTDELISSIETCATNDSSEASDHTFFDSLLDGYDYVCPKDGWNLKSWDELLMSDDESLIEDKEEINLTLKANDVDQLRRLPPPPTYLESRPFILLPPSRRDELRILELDRAKTQTGWHQKRVKRAKLYDSRIGKSRKKWVSVELRTLKKRLTGGNLSFK